MTPI
jgi:hypothetical protein